MPEEKTMRVFSLRAYRVNARRVYRPAALQYQYDTLMLLGAAAGNLHAAQGRYLAGVRLGTLTFPGYRY